MNSRVYLGHVIHERVEPRKHGFRYPAFMFGLDLDELPALGRTLRLFGHNRRGLFSLHDGDYLGAIAGDLRAKLRHRVDASDTRVDLDRVVLVTVPRVAGHAFNPVSFFYCYGADETLSGVVVEVNNTFGEAHVYVLPSQGPARENAGDSRGTSRRNHPQGLRIQVAKEFHVSPFNPVQGLYEFDFAPLTEKLDVRIDILRGRRKAFASRIVGSGRPLDGKALRRLALTYPFTAALTLPRILYQAYQLHYRKELPVFEKPEPSSRQTFRATRPPYVSELAITGRRAQTETREHHGNH